MKTRKPATRPANNVITIPRGLNRQHKLVINDLFENGLTESQVCERHGLAMEDLRQWYRDDAFRQEVSLRLFVPVSLARIVLARAAADVASRLVAMTYSDKEEIARKACLNIIGLLPWVHDEVADTGSDSSRADFPRLTADTTSRFLAILAEERQLNSEARATSDRPLPAPETPVRKLEQLNRLPAGCGDHSPAPFPLSSVTGEEVSEQEPTP